ncbi:DUF3306 domain-containing protein [Pararhodobacter sp. SW119]|uniref:DUF3306 domain-containing protein n=1 Tax=Pararhodobacter sp. SW119 TaxID=2780075 RepID=UPI001ADEDDCD|nr:DUF3306 domain-containing protein [Pararhodobacter sp. SW119]
MSEKPFLERWAARKSDARDAAAAADDAEAAGSPGPQSREPAQDPAAPTAPAPAQPISEDELAALPPVDTLTVGSDIKAFLRPGVPAPLKNAALRRMWMLTPAIRDHSDIAVDYAWDWNTPGGVPGDGGTLDPERVAQWVRDIVNRREPDDPPPAEDAETEAQGDPGQDASPTQLQDDLPGEAAPTARSSRTGTESAGAADARSEGSAEPHAVAPPRHGGARPA